MTHALSWATSMQLLAPRVGYQLCIHPHGSDSKNVNILLPLNFTKIKRLSTACSWFQGNKSRSAWLEVFSVVSPAATHTHTPGSVCLADLTSQAPFVGHSGAEEAAKQQSESPACKEVFVFLSFHITEKNLKVTSIKGKTGRRYVYWWCLTNGRGTI